MPNTENNIEEVHDVASEEPIISPERAAHLRNLNAAKKNYADMLDSKYLSRTHGDQFRD
ncbi:hypothetical protein [Neorhizobium galegae]|uniref:hypothetical protein n=1 Tax=Neorhizobium galegae TaxID=399 RepID=UPI000620F496|nr:hypothetical protein [Neorhizobium galegae]MCQ1805274.1 hypothetical protein [Neorhizobium galegae]CDZ56035.1 Hypothetical protein NGAL_HAMBI2566_05850 [Neorhizobium galegae bv. orientalis]